MSYTLLYTGEVLPKVNLRKKPIFPKYYNSIKITDLEVTLAVNRHVKQPMEPTNNSQYKHIIA